MALFQTPFKSKQNFYVKGQSNIIFPVESGLSSDVATAYTRSYKLT